MTACVVYAWYISCLFYLESDAVFGLQYKDEWIGRKGPVLKPPRSPHLNPAASVEPFEGRSLLEKSQHAGRPLEFVEAAGISQNTGISWGDRAQLGSHMNGE